jgi:aminoglycoside phosphotransferase (APT) family kinase protein
VELDLGNGIILTGADEKTAKGLLARKAFIAQYCKGKGWDADDLTITQVLEIRAQEGWKNPLATAP